MLSQVIQLSTAALNYLWIWQPHCHRNSSVRLEILRHHLSMVLPFSDVLHFSQKQKARMKQRGIGESSYRNSSSVSLHTGYLL